jgi:hypothetical protein
MITPAGDELSEAAVSVRRLITWWSCVRSSRDHDQIRGRLPVTRRRREVVLGLVGEGLSGGTPDVARRAVHQGSHHGQPHHRAEAAAATRPAMGATESQPTLDHPLA